MVNILGLEILALVSLLFGILNIFLNFASINYLFLSYIWIFIISLSASMLYGKNKLYRFILILGFLPLYFFRDKTAFSFFFLAIILIYTYIEHGLNRGGYEDLARRFKSSFLFLGGLALFAIISMSLREKIQESLLFFIIYIFSSIIQIRSIRHLESGMDINTLKKVNIRYFVIISIFSIIVVVDSIRNYIFNIIGSIYQWIMNLFILIIYYPANLIIKLLEFIFIGIRNQGQELDLDGSINTGEIDFNHQQGEPSEILTTLISFLVSALVIILIIYIAYRILRGLGNRAYKTIDYKQEKEYIKPIKEKRRFLRERYPKGYREQIRYYYRRYLEKLEKNNIEINKSDTSLDIKNKTKNEFTNTNKIRDIYIEARYKKEEPKKERVEEIRNAYKNM